MSLLVGPSHIDKTDMAALSDPESTTAPPHPNLGGKSIQSLERPKYKSWRKKYRKMRHHFDGVLEDNKRLFKEEQKLETIAKRLREELEYGTPSLKVKNVADTSLTCMQRLARTLPRHQSEPSPPA